MGTISDLGPPTPPSLSELVPSSSLIICNSCMIFVLVVMDMWNILGEYQVKRINVKVAFHTRQTSVSLPPRPCDLHEPSSSEQKLETLEQLAAELSFPALPVDRKKSTLLRLFMRRTLKASCCQYKNPASFNVKPVSDIEVSAAGFNSPRLLPGSFWAEAGI